MESSPSSDLARLAAGASQPAPGHGQTAGRRDKKVARVRSASAADHISDLDQIPNRPSLRPSVWSM